MIQIRVLRFNDALGRQFVAWVNRLLPAGSRFRLEPMPHLEYVDTSPGIAFPSGTTSVREYVGEARLDVNPDAPGSTSAQEPWRRRFRDELERLVRDPGRIATVELISGDQGTMVGEFRLRTLDIGDLGRMADMMAASALIHELEEQTHRGTHPWEAPAYDEPHRQAMTVESRICGGERLENLELRHPANVDVTNASRNQRWIWWIPFRTPEGALWVNQLEMMGRNVLQARLGRYPDEGAYRHAFNAGITARRLDVARAGG